MSLTLYPDQVELIEAVRKKYREGFRKVAMGAPTGSGKTVMAGDIMRRVQVKGGTTLVLAHRVEIIRQFERTARKHGLTSVSVISPGRPEQPWETHHLAMVQTLVHRLHKTRLDPSLLVVDEGHHSVSKTYLKVLDRFKRAKLLLLSATLERPDGKGLGDVCDVIVQGPGTRRLIEMKRLSPYELFSVPVGLSDKKIHTLGGDYVRGELEEDLFDDGEKKIAAVKRAILEHAKGYRWIAFGPTIRASKFLEQSLLESGVSCSHIDGTLNDWERRLKLERFAKGYYDGLLSVDLISEGFDCPEADCAILYRRTKSIVVYLQSIGRVLRFLDGKVARILDCAELWKQPDLGLPCDDHVWSLDGRAGAKTISSAPTMRMCQACFLVQPAGRSKCLECGAAFAAAVREPDKEVDVSLVRISIDPLMEDLVLEQRKDGTYKKEQVAKAVRQARDMDGEAGIHKLGRTLGYKPGWAKHQIRLYVKR